jgi:dihydrofolate reductase
MRRIVAFESVTLDGVMQAPGRPDEDTRGGFTHGGWAVPYADEVVAGMAGEGTASTDAILLGRRTYEDFYGFWPKQGDDNPFTRILNETQKYVVSRTLHEPLEWKNSTLLPDTDAVARVREEDGGDIVLLGSGELARDLTREGLVDEYVLLIHPLVLGSGKRLFEQGLSTSALELVDTRTSTTGVIIAKYRPQSAVRGAVR